MIDPAAAPANPGEVGRVDGGRSARVAAVAVATVLLAVAWIGASGKSAPRSPISTSPAVAVASLDTPATSTTANPAAGRQRAQPAAAASTEIFGAFLQFEHSQFITILDEVQRGHLVGRLNLPAPLPEGDGIFAFEQFSPPTADFQPIHLGDWPIALGGPSRRSTTEDLLLEVSVPARPQLLNVPRPVTRGYDITVSAVEGSAGTIDIDIVLGPNRRIVGDDGLFGFPPPVSHPLERGPDNSCRWDQSPGSLPPRPGTTESDC
jgi:hypothetical protein